MKRLLTLSFAALVVVLVAGCASATVDDRIRANRALYDSWPLEVREKVASGRVDLGMTQQMVEVAIGRPARQVDRLAANETTQVWYYARSRPRISFGVGMGFGGYHGYHGRHGFGTSIGVSTGDFGRYEPEETMRVVFRDGLVESVDVRRID